jgi:hypothetical protein
MFVAFVAIADMVLFLIDPFDRDGSNLCLSA